MTVKLFSAFSFLQLTHGSHNTFLDTDIFLATFWDYFPTPVCKFLFHRNISLIYESDCESYIEGIAGYVKRKQGARYA